jgi:hypothetical protein
MGAGDGVEIHDTTNIRRLGNGESASPHNRPSCRMRGKQASGFLALIGNTTGSNNTANGAFALQFNTTASNNTATGYGALSNNTTGRSG